MTVSAATDPSTAPAADTSPPPTDETRPLPRPLTPTPAAGVTEDADPGQDIAPNLGGESSMQDA